MRTYKCDCGSVEHLLTMIPDCCSLCGGSLEQVAGPPPPAEWVPPDDFIAAMRDDDVEPLATHYCRCRELDVQNPAHWADILCDSCSLCGGSVHAIAAQGHSYTVQVG